MRISNETGGVKRTPSSSGAPGRRPWPPNLFFDLDGTLTDPREGFVRSLRHALETLGVTTPPDADLARFIGPPLEDSLRSLLWSAKMDLLPRAVELYRQRYAAVGMFENRVYDGIPAALSALGDAGFRLWLVTSKPQVFAVSILRHFGLSKHFHAIYGSELSGQRSDKGELIAYVLETERLAATDAVMIGDRSHDVVAARRNGLDAIGVLWGYGSREELLGAGAVCVHATISALATDLLPARNL